MCKSDDGVSCDHVLNDWNSGWLIFDNLDRNSTAHVDPGEPILQVRGLARRQTPIISNRNSFTFRPMDLHSVNGTFRYCSEDGRYDHALIVNVMGRIRISDTPKHRYHTHLPLKVRNAAAVCAAPGARQTPYAPECRASH